MHIKFFFIEINYTIWPPIVILCMLPILIFIGMIIAHAWIITSLSKNVVKALAIGKGLRFA